MNPTIEFILVPKTRLFGFSFHPFFFPVFGVQKKKKKKKKVKQEPGTASHKIEDFLYIVSTATQPPKTPL